MNSWEVVALGLRERNTRLQAALERASDDFQTIQTLSSGGASAETYIGWLRSNARDAEARARAALAQTGEGSNGCA